MFNRKQLIIIIVKEIIKTLVVLGLAIAAISYLEGQIGKISKTLEEQHVGASILETKTDAISKLRQDFMRIGDADKAIAKAVPPADDILDFVSALDSLSAQNSLVQNINYSTPVVGPDGTYIDYSISSNGNIVSLIGYLRSHERLPYLTYIKSIVMGAQGNNWEGDSRIELSGRLFVSPAQNNNL